MGSNATPTGTLSGVMVPWAMTNTGGVPGGGAYTCQSTKPGPLVPDTATALRMEATLPPSTSYPSTVTQLDVMAVSPGTPGATRATNATGPSAGVAYKKNGAGDWYGCDDWHVLTGSMREVDAIASDAVGLAQPSMVARSDGTIAACWMGTAGVFHATRSADGVWSSPINLTIATVSRIACMTRAPDASLLTYVYLPTSNAAVPEWTIGVLRSTDGGTVWRVVTTDVGIPAITNANMLLTNRIRAASANGAVVLFINTQTAGPAYYVAQHVSTDGGFAFRQVVAPTAGYGVLDACTRHNLIHVISCDTVTATYRPLASPTGSWLATAGVDIGASAVTPLTQGAVAVSPNTTILAQLAELSGSGLQGFKSTDRGLTWADSGPSFNGNNSANLVACPALAFSRGTLVGLITDGTASSGLYEIRWGGNTNSTVGSEISGASAALDSWYALEELTGSGWTDTEAGTPTHTLNTDGNGYRSEKIVTGAAETCLLESPSTAGSGFGSIAAVVIRPDVVGASPVYIRFIAYGIGTRVDLTATQIRAYDDTGAASSYVNHGAASGQYVEIFAIMDSVGARSIVSFRVLDETAERTFTQLPAITSQAATAGTVQRVFINIGNDSTVYINRVTRYKADRLTLGAGWTASPGRPYTLDPISLSNAPAHLTGGIDVTCIGGIATVDGSTHTTYPVSVYRAENVLPTVSPSPRSVWRSGSLATQTLTYTPPATDRNALTAIYLDGLIGVGAVGITAGIAAATVTLSTSIKYRALGGNALSMSGTGTNVNGPWVRADYLKDWRFKDATGNIRRVTGNSEGCLTSGATFSEHRAVIYLDGTTDAATDGTGTLYPNRALILGHMANTPATKIESVILSIVEASNPAVTEGYRQIGVMAAGRVHILGEAPDMGDVYAMDSAASVQTLADGTRHSARRHNDRKRVEWAFANSPHAVRAMTGATASPDYVVLTTGSDPNASNSGIPFVVEGIVRRAAGTDAPVVWIPRITAQGSDGWSATTFGLDHVTYGRIVGTFRREAVMNVGDRSGTQIYRVPTVVIEEEL